MKKLLAIISIVLFVKEASAEFMEIGGVYFCESNFARYYKRSEGDTDITPMAPQRFKFSIIDHETIMFGEGMLGGVTIPIQDLRTNILIASNKFHTFAMENNNANYVMATFDSMITMQASCDKF